MGEIKASLSITEALEGAVGSDSQRFWLDKKKW